MTKPRETLSPNERYAIYEEGKEDWYNGLTIYDNPYDEDSKRDMWLLGWRYMQDLDEAFQYGYE